VRNILLILFVVALGVASYFWIQPQLAGNGAAAGGRTGASVVAEPGIPSGATDAWVECVHDGGTLFLQDGRKVRPLGINTPVIGGHLECYGNEATAALRAMLPEGTHVWVPRDRDPLDQYGRSLLFSYTDAGTNVNLALLKLGDPEVRPFKPNYLLSDELHTPESAARDARVLSWRACGRGEPPLLRALGDAVPHRSVRWLTAGALVPEPVEGSDRALPSDDAAAASALLADCTRVRAD
jgi:micrococcal nuclease